MNKNSNKSFRKIKLKFKNFKSTEYILTFFTKDMYKKFIEEK